MNNRELRALRTRLGLTQAALAKAVGVAPNTLARWERGELALPDSAAERLNAIAQDGPSGAAVTRPQGVVLDPHHGEILEALERRLDPEVFESCAASLLGKQWPGLVSIRGGSDDGFDGAVADGRRREPFPLIVTTAKKELHKNLRRSVEQARRKGWTVERALFATPRRITPRMRRSLFETARELDIQLVQTYDQDWFAYRLYQEPDLCKSLLGVTGKPAALSVFPLTRRPVLGDDVLGREQEMRWLLDRQRDCLLVGQPGSGKTFLLRALVLRGRGLFLVDADPKQVANDIRRLRPEAIIVDDAHVDPRRIAMLMQLRREIRANQVRIIATSWPSEASQIAADLQLTTGDTLELGQIDADTMVEIIKSIGITGPDELVREIREQAGGRPGLAVTLAHLCVEGDVRQVVTGESVFDSLASDLNRMLDYPDASRFLATFAIGGNAGVRPNVVANYLRESTIKVSGALARLAAAGIVRQRHNHAVSIEPAQMRWALVRRAFFGGVGSLEYAPLLENVENPEDALDTLIHARACGAAVPELEEHLERLASPRLWSLYASLGAPEAHKMVHDHPELIEETAHATLTFIPETVIPMLLDREHEAKAPSDSALQEGPMNKLEIWAKGVSPATENVLYRRTTLIRAADRWWQQNHDSQVALRAMHIAMSPAFEYTKSDPGAGRQIIWTRGRLREHELQALSELWPMALNIARNDPAAPWSALFDLTWDWLHPDRQVEFSESTQNLMRECAGRMLHDLADVSHSHPGIQHRLRDIAEQAGFTLKLELDPDFETLYPKERIDENYEEIDHAPQTEALATRWGNRSPEEIASFLANIEHEAQQGGIGWPRESVNLCMYLAKLMPHPLEVAETFMHHEIAADLVQPFIYRVSRESLPGWTGLVQSCLEADHYRWVGVSVVITHPDPPAEILSRAVNHASDVRQVIETFCLRGEVPPNTFRTLLESEDSGVAVAAAIGHWLAIRRSRTNDWRNQAWRRAILRSLEDKNRNSHDAHWIGTILSQDPPLATEWLQAKLSQGRTVLRYEVGEIAEKVIPNLNIQQRRKVLGMVRADFGATNLVAHLVGDDLELYRELLDSKELVHHHLSPLAGVLDEDWRTRARLASDAGYSADEIVHATLGQRWSWSGPESGMWAQRRLAFEPLLDDADSRIAQVGERGVAIMGKRQEQAYKREREEAVHGL